MCLNHSRSCKRCHNILKEWQLVYEHDRMKCWWIRCADCAIHYLYCVTEGMKDRGNNFILIWCVLVKMIFFLYIITPPPSIWEPLHLIEYPTMYFIVVDILLKHGCKDSRLGRGVMCNVVALLQFFLFNAEIFLKSWNDVHVVICFDRLLQLLTVPQYILKERAFSCISVWLLRIWDSL